VMTATGKQRQTGVGEGYLETTEGHLTPKVKAASEVTCDYVWDKPYRPISVTCSKQYIRKAPFVLGTQPLDSSPLRCCWHV
jgi:hypothetical protein